MIIMETNGFNPFSLSGKTVLVTGASSGIGRETAVRCSHMGARVIVTARDGVRLQETMAMLAPVEGDGHQQLLADLTSSDEMDNLLKALPSLDGAVLCAGNSVTLPLQFGTRDKFDSMFEVNFFSPVELMRLMYKIGRAHV